MGLSLEEELAQEGIFLDVPELGLTEEELEQLGVFNGQPDLGSFTSEGSTTLPDGSEISDTFSSWSDAANEVEISEEELPSMIENLYSTSSDVSTQGAQEMFAESSLESSIEGLDENIEALEAEIEALEADVEALTVQIEGLEAAVAEEEIAVEGAAAEVTAAAEEVTVAAAAVAAADASEAADWWTIIGGIISGVAIVALAAALYEAKLKYDEAQRKKTEKQDDLDRDDKDLHDKNHELSSKQAKRESKLQYKEKLVQKKSEKTSEMEKSRNKIEAYKLIHKAIIIKLWFIKYWMVKNKKKPGRPINVPDRKPVEPVTVKEGGEHETIRIIRASDKADRDYWNKEYKDTYGGGNKLAVIWEHVNKPSAKLKTFETVKIWASNNGVSKELHSQCGIFGVIGESAYELGLEAVGSTPKLCTFYENGKIKHEKAQGNRFELDKFDSFFLCVRSAPFPAWQAACHGFEIQYICN